MDDQGRCGGQLDLSTTPRLDFGMIARGARQRYARQELQYLPPRQVACVNVIEPAVVEAGPRSQRKPTLAPAHQHVERESRPFDEGRIVDSDGQTRAAIVVPEGP